MIVLNNRIQTFLETFFTTETEHIQSLLFYGEEGIGKKTVALSFAQALLCEQFPSQWGGCGKCDNCLRFAKGLQPDFLFLEPQEGKIAIENIRQALEFLSYEPQFSKFKILIIDQADTLREEAQNALLKTLEEPPARTLIILISSFPQRLLSTILSRVLLVRFPRLPSEKITEFLVTQEKIPVAQAQKIAELAQGKISRALALSQTGTFKKVAETEKQLELILGSNFLQRSKYLTQLTKEKDSLKKILKIWLEKINSDLKDPSTKISPQLGKALLKAFDLISNSNINSTLLLENIFFSYD